MVSGAAARKELGTRERFKVTRASHLRNAFVGYAFGKRQALKPDGVLHASKSDMILSATILGVAVFANVFPHPRVGDTARKPTPPSIAALPPIQVVVDVAPGTSASIVPRTLAEAGDIWRLLGITLDWQVAGRTNLANTTGDEVESSALHVTIDDDASMIAGARAALGWIMFTAPDAPGSVIHLSRASALRLFDTMPGVREMPLVLRDTLIARALGRALAHELGHYLLGSAHTPHGLMQGLRPAGDFFSIGRNGFDLTPEQRDALVRRVKMTPPV